MAVTGHLVTIRPVKAILHRPDDLCGIPLDCDLRRVNLMRGLHFGKHLAQRPDEIVARCGRRSPSFRHIDNHVFGEDFDVRIKLTSAVPNIYMCVSRYETANNVNECYPDANKQCGLKTFRRDGSYGAEDGALFFIKVYRDQAGPATCTPYTLYMSNG